MNKQIPTDNKTILALIAERIDIIANGNIKMYSR
jgi:hypothetical protein